jgi:DNA (cytosine-5)-methyltransferase 1
MTELVLSLFGGLGLLDMGFEQHGFVVVRGPDLLWGRDIRDFHAPAGRFDAVVGGPPCQAFSSLAHLVRHNGHQPRYGNLIPEFERVVHEAQPTWWLMENVEQAPVPTVPGYVTRDIVLNNRWVGGEQHRRRRFSFGTRDGRELHVDVVAFECPTWSPAVTGDMRTHTSPTRVRTKPGGGVMPHAGTLAPLAEMCRLQGLPEDYCADLPFTERAKRQMVGNGVALPMGRAIAAAVRRAMA